jgi:hypothetical protein
LKNETISWLGSVDGLKELKELEDVEICERRSTAPLEGAIHVWVRADNTFAVPMNRTGTPSAAIGRSHPRLGTPCRRHEWVRPSQGRHLCRHHPPRHIHLRLIRGRALPLRTGCILNVVFLRAKWTLSFRCSGFDYDGLPTGFSWLRRESNASALYSLDPVQMSTHKGELDPSAGRLETMGRRMEMMKTAVWGRGAAEKRWSSGSARESSSVSNSGQVGAASTSVSVLVLVVAVSI